MDFLLAEINRKKKEAEEAKKKLNGGTESSGQDVKYLRRGELERIRQQEYLEEEERERNKKKLKSSHVPSISNQAPLIKETAQEENAPLKAQQGHQQLYIIPSNTSALVAEERLVELEESEIKSRLRSRNHPVTLFGETMQDRIIRLQKIIAQEHRAKPVTFRNLLDATEQNLEESKYKGEDNVDNTVQPLQDKILDVDTRGISMILVKNDMAAACDLMSAYFKKLMKLWEIHLNQRPEEVKRTPKGKLQSITHAQTVEHLKPFYRGLRKGSLANDILGHVATICEHMQNKEYMQANDAYIRLAIGNSPWPIGVTNSGIHERAADDRIKTSEVAHVLNDETTRK